MKNNLYAILYSFSYMALGSFTPLIAQYLNSKGFDGSQIGAVTASATAVAIVAVSFWGRAYSGLKTSKSRATLISILCLGAAAVSISLSLSDSFTTIFVLLSVLYFLQAPVTSLVDSFTILAGTENSEDPEFGSKRAWGAVGFAVGVFMAGKAAGEAGEQIIFYIYSVSFLITALVLTVMSAGSRIDTEADSRDRAPLPESGTKRYTDLLKDRKVCALLLCMFFMGGTNVANNTYFAFLYLEGGGTVAGMGIAMLLMVGSEVPFMAWCDRLSKKFGMQRIIMAAMVVSSVRFLIYGIGMPWWILLAMFATQGAVNGILLVEFVRYISSIAPKNCKSLAVSAYYIIGSNVSTICCQLIGGLILESFGASAVYLFFGLFNLTGVLLYAIFRLNRI